MSSLGETSPKSWQASWAVKWQFALQLRINRQSVRFLPYLSVTIALLRRSINGDRKDLIALISYTQTPREMVYLRLKPCSMDPESGLGDTKSGSWRGVQSFKAPAEAAWNDEAIFGAMESRGMSRHVDYSARGPNGLAPYEDSAIAWNSADTLDVVEETTSDFEPSWIGVVAKSISAGLYLLDWVSNILVLKVYFELSRYGKYNNESLTRDCTGGSNEWHFDLTGFALSLSFMVVAHIATLVAFKITLPAEEQPCRSAFFLPLVQFRRLLSGIFQAGTCGKNSGPPESLEAESLYAIMAAAAETAPQLSLQFTLVVSIGALAPCWKPTGILVLSLVASLLSGAYNTGRAIMYCSSMRWTFTLNALGIAGGLYTLGALLLRCTVAAAVAVSRPLTHANAKLLLGLYVGLGVFPVSYITAVLCLRKSEKLCTCATHLRVQIFSWISGSLGPLYPVVVGLAHEKRHLNDSSKIEYYRVPLVVIINLLFDVVCVIILTVKNCSPCTGKNFRWTGEPLSGTLTCAVFTGLVVTGVALSVSSVTVFMYFLVVSDAGRAAAAVEEERSLAEVQSESLNDTPDEGRIFR